MQCEEWYNSWAAKTLQNLTCKQVFCLFQCLRESVDDEALVLTRLWEKFFSEELDNELVVKASVVLISRFFDSLQQLLILTAQIFLFLFFLFFFFFFFLLLLLLLLILYRLLLFLYFRLLLCLGTIFQIFVLFQQKHTLEVNKQLMRING